MTKSLELTDKLDAPASPVVNGPEDDVLDWLSVDWQTVEDDVRRLRQRIFTASRHGDLAKGPQSAKADAPVTSQRSRERAAGDRAQRWPQDGRRRRDGCGDCARQDRCWPTRCSTARRLLGAQARQAGVHPEGQRETAPARDSRDLSTGLAKPRWSTRWNPSGRHGSSRSRMAFGPGVAATTRSSPSSTPLSGKSARRCWVLDADLAAAFDRIDHSHLLAALGSFPARGLVERWLKAGVVEHGRLAPTEEGTPQGGVVSPLLLNMALHGMEEAAGVRYQHRPKGRCDGEEVPRRGSIRRRPRGDVHQCASRPKRSRLV